MTIETPISSVVQDRVARFLDRALRDFSSTSAWPDSRAAGTYYGRPRNREVAAIVRDLEDLHTSTADSRWIGKFASAVGNCGQLVPRPINGLMQEVPMRCQRHLPCRSCSWIRSCQLGEADAARVLLAHELDPSLTFVLLSTLVPEMDDLSQQLDLLRSGIGQLRDATYQGSQVIRGGIWQIEVANGMNGRYRSHAHITAAVANASLDALVAVLAHWVDTTRPGLTGDQRRRTIMAQHVTLLWAHGKVPEGTPPVALDLAQDAYAVSRYGSKAANLSAREALRAFAGVNGSKLRDTWGVLRGHKEADRERALDEVGGRACLIRVNNSPGDATRPPRAWTSANRKRRRAHETMTWRAEVSKALVRLNSDGRAGARPCARAEGPSARPLATAITTPDIPFPTRGRRSRSPSSSLVLA